MRLIALIYQRACKSILYAKNSFVEETIRLKKDQRGMETLQAILVLLMAIIVIALIWIFFEDAIIGIVDSFFEQLNHIVS